MWSNHGKRNTAVALIVAVALVAAVMASVPHARGPSAIRPPTPARVALQRELDSLDRALDALSRSLAASQKDAAKEGLRAARVRYKRVETLVAYYAPTLAGLLNGPVEEGESDDAPMPLGRPAAFAVVASALAADEPESNARETVSAMLRSIRGFRAALPLLDVADTNVLDATRLELARVASLGLAGADGEQFDAMRESAAALDGMGEFIISTRSIPVRSRDRLLMTLDSASRFIRSSPSFDSLDRLQLIATLLQPAAQEVRDLRRAIDPRAPMARRLWRASSASPFDADAFDPWALSPEYARDSSAAIVERGRALFFDPRLSGSGARSCASCHVPPHAFTDGRVRAASMSDAHGSVLRNTPTLWNASLQPALFDDQRAATLEDQIGMVLASEAEMRSSASRAAAKVGLDERSLRTALAAYVRSLTALDARFDRAVRGDTNALNAEERRGFNVFMGKARCGTCHFAPLFDGTRPPEYVRSELEIIGVPGSDSGRARVDGSPIHVGAFRVPSLRNVALTAPYMHNGAFATLQDVIGFYDRGGGHVSNQTLPPRPLHLTTDERRALVSFLATLTDTVTNRNNRVAMP